MYRWKHQPETVSMRGFAVSVAWILLLLGGYWVAADWHRLSDLAWAVLTFGT